MALATVVHDDVTSLAPVWAEWDALAAAAGRPGALSAWMTAWALHVGDGELRVVTVHDGPELLGVLPCVLVRVALGTRQLRLLGAGTTTTIEPLARAGREAEVAAAAAAALHRDEPRADVLALEGIPAGSPWPRLLAAHWPGSRPGMLQRDDTAPEPLLELVDDGFDAWLAGRSGNFRGQIRRARRALDRAGGEVRRSTGPAELERDLDAFVRLHEARWASRGGSGVIGGEVRRMLADAGPRLLASDHLDLWCVETAGTVAAAQLWLRAGPVTTMWLSGSDDAFAELRPAMLIMAAAVEDGFERGLRTVSFGSGGQAYKRRFTDAQAAVEWWTLVLPGPRLALTLGAVQARRARRELGRRLGDERKASLNTVARRLTGRRA